jgi:hypothetical protein
VPLIMFVSSYGDSGEDMDDGVYVDDGVIVADVVVDVVAAGPLSRRHGRRSEQ